MTDNENVRDTHIRLDEVDDAELEYLRERLHGISQSQAIRTAIRELAHRLRTHPEEIVVPVPPPPHGQRHGR